MESINRKLRCVLIDQILGYSELESHFSVFNIRDVYDFMYKQPIDCDLNKLFPL